MTDYKKLYDGISRAAWGYLLIYFNFNFNNINILPTFAGYLLFLYAISYLKDEERELSLLRTLCVILTLWHAAVWIAGWFSFELDGIWQFADILICVVNLYFHFQLLTNLASVAAKYQPEGYALDTKLLSYRTIQTVMLTAINVISHLYAWFTNIWIIVSLIMTLVFLIAGICLMKALFDLRKCLPKNDETHLSADDI